MNGGEIPWKETKTVSMVGFIAAIVIGGIILFTMSQVPLAIARADALNRNGIQKLNKIQTGDGLESLSLAESAKSDFIQAHETLNSVRDFSNPGQQDLQSKLLITEILINESDVSASGVKAFYHQSRMASLMKSHDWRPLPGRKIDFRENRVETIYTNTQRISMTLSTLERTSDMSVSADFISRGEKEYRSCSIPRIISG